ncbi:MAG: hypothetical protein IJC88_06175 [Oscillospiraceae bacterium]|nr:hypothetical protein [Oscillospiraceae bacterium]
MLAFLLLWSFHSAESAIGKVHEDGVNINYEKDSSPVTTGQGHNKL